MDLTSIRYEVADYIDVLKSQLSADVFKETKKAVYLSSIWSGFKWLVEKNRDLKALVKLFENVVSIGIRYYVGP